jgi:phosphopantothenoylcysteine decarboxylase/phosphopantothenate--cysteine ligase
MHAEVLARVDGLGVAILAAAVADYAPVNRAAQKMSKAGDSQTLELRRTPDILADLGSRRRKDGRGPILVGFAAETGATGLERARVKLSRKGADLFVLNDVARTDIGFDAYENEVTLITAAAERTVAKAPKDEIAAAILDEVETLIRNG